MGTMGAVAAGGLIGTMAGNAIAGPSSADKEKEAKAKEAEAHDKEAKELQRKADEAKAKADAARAATVR
jgi:hypothetical protein